MHFRTAQIFSDSVMTIFYRSFFGSSRISSQSTVESVNEEIEDTVYKRDVPIIPTASYGHYLFNILF